VPSVAESEVWESVWEQLLRFVPNVFEKDVHGRYSVVCENHQDEDANRYKYIFLRARTMPQREQKRFCREDEKEEDQEEADEGEVKGDYRVKIPLLILLKGFLPNNRMIPKFVKLMYLKTRVPTHQRRPSPARTNFILVVAHDIFSIHPVGL
jgi:hypothetical protein